MVVGSDYEQKSSQFKSQQKGHGYSVFYGHGEGKDENKTGINKYLREVDKGISKLLKGEKVPLVVAGADYLFSIDDIVPAAVHGKIDTLFILKNQDVFGMYNDVSEKVKHKEGAELAEVSLFNLAAKEAFLHKGNVYLVEKEEMPDGFSIINALYRY